MLQKSQNLVLFNKKQTLTIYSSENKSRACLLFVRLSGIKNTKKVATYSSPLVMALTLYQDKENRGWQGWRGKRNEGRERGKVFTASTGD